MQAKQSIPKSRHPLKPSNKPLNLKMYATLEQFMGAFATAIKLT